MRNWRICVCESVYMCLCEQVNVCMGIGSGEFVEREKDASVCVFVGSTEVARVLFRITLFTLGTLLSCMASIPHLVFVRQTTMTTTTTTTSWLAGVLARVTLFLNHVLHKFISLQDWWRQIDARTSIRVWKGVYVCAWNTFRCDEGNGIQGEGLSFMCECVNVHRGIEFDEDGRYCFLFSLRFFSCFR